MGEPLEQRFWARVDKRGPGECWPWTGSVRPSGRGVLWIDGHHRHATWAALQLDGRPRPSEEHEACHTCDNPGCVNPAHLWWGTRSENMLDCLSKGRHFAQTKTHCPSGHALSGENLRINSEGFRECRTCRRARQLKHIRRKRQCQAAA